MKMESVWMGSYKLQINSSVSRSNGNKGVVVDLVGAEQWPSLANCGRPPWGSMIPLDKGDVKMDFEANEKKIA